MSFLISKDFLYFIYHKKLNKYGYIQINDTRINDYWGEDIQFQTIKLDLNDNLHCTWGGLPLSGNYSYYTKIDINGNILINNTNPTGYSLYPLIIDSKGYIHKIFGNNYDLFYLKCDNNGKLLCKYDENGKLLSGYKRITFANKPYFSFDVGSVIDSDDNIHLIFGRYPRGEPFDLKEDLYYMKLNNNGDILVNETQLTFNRNAYAKTVNIGIDSNDNIHLTWFDFRDNNTKFYYHKYPTSYSLHRLGCFYYRKLDKYGNTVIFDKKIFNKENNLSNELFDGIPEDIDPKDVEITFDAPQYLHFALDSKDNIYLIYSKEIIELSPNRYIFYQKLDNNGNKINNETRISTKSGGAPKIIIDSDDKIHVVWIKDSELYYKSNSLKNK